MPGLAAARAERLRQKSVSQTMLAGMVAGAAFATAAVFAACMAVVGLTVLEWNWKRLMRQSTQAAMERAAAGGGTARADAGATVAGLQVRPSESTRRIAHACGGSGAEHGDGAR